MKKQFVIGLFVTTSLATTALAQADHSGSWHSVDSRSSWSNGELPKGFSLTIAVKFTKNKIVYHSVNDTDRNTVSGLDFTASLDGQVSTVSSQPKFNQISVKTLDEDNIEILEMKDGDVIVGSFWTFAKDGKTFVRRGVGKALDGKSKAFEEVFERKY